MLKPKVGDFVRLKPHIVVEVTDTEVLVRSTIDYAHWVSFDIIEKIVPRPLEVGDRVKFIGVSAEVKLLGLHGIWAWIFRKNVGYETVETKKLERIDGDKK